MLISDKTLDGKPLSLLTSGSDKKVELKCDMCGKVSTTTYHNYILSQIKNENNGKTKCKSCSTSITGKNKIGQPAWNKGIKKPATERTGKSFISNDGYKMVFKYKESANSKWEHYRKEHIILMEQFLGRELTQEEEIHHLNGDKLDNELGNLLLTNKNEHKQLHHSLQLVAYELYKKGLIFFDFLERKYKIKE